MNHLSVIFSQYGTRRVILDCLSPIDIRSLVAALADPLTLTEERRYLKFHREVFIDTSWLDDLVIRGYEIALIGRGLNSLCDRLLIPLNNAQHAPWTTITLVIASQDRCRFCIQQEIQTLFLKSLAGKVRYCRRSGRLIADSPQSRCSISLIFADKEPCLITMGDQQAFDLLGKQDSSVLSLSYAQYANGTFSLEQLSSLPNTSIRQLNRYDTIWRFGSNRVILRVIHHSPYWSSVRPFFGFN